jgi:hypothetical protein
MKVILHASRPARRLMVAVLVVTAGFVGAIEDQAGEPADLPADLPAALAMSVQVQVVASDPELTSNTLASFADENGGYFTLRSLDQVILRIPDARVPEIRSLVERLGDTIVSYNPSMRDLSEQLAQAEAAITSRTEALDRVLSYLADASIAATLAFERELRSLNQEIEYYTGRRRAMQNDVHFANVNVRLTTRQSTIPTKLPSSFDWINTIDLYRFVDEIRYREASR